MNTEEWELIGKRFLDILSKNIILGKENTVFVDFKREGDIFTEFTFSCYEIIRKYKLNDKNYYTRKIYLENVKNYTPNMSYFGLRLITYDNIDYIIQKYIYYNDLGFDPYHYKIYYYYKYCICLIYSDYKTKDEDAPYSIQLDRTNGEIIFIETSLH